MVKFYGKWPFYRVLSVVFDGVKVCGMQEFFSVVFSIGNLVVNVFYLRELFKQRLVYDRFYLMAFASMGIFR